jgi:hypothetical protein
LLIDQCDGAPDTSSKVAHIKKVCDVLNVEFSAKAWGGITATMDDKSDMLTRLSDHILYRTNRTLNAAMDTLLGQELSSPKDAATWKSIKSGHASWLKRGKVGTLNPCDSVQLPSV